MLDKIKKYTVLWPLFVALPLICVFISNKISTNNKEEVVSAELDKVEEIINIDDLILIELAKMNAVLSYNADVSEKIVSIIEDGGLCLRSSTGGTASASDLIIE